MKTQSARQVVRQVWAKRGDAFLIQKRARALGLHADVQNAEQAARHGDEVQDCPPYLSQAGDYLSQAVLLTVECRADQVDAVFFG